MSLNSVSKRKRTENISNSDVNRVEDKSGLASVTLEPTTTQVFTEDLLPEIFDNLGILAVNDLLNFRLVNRCWRNAATSVLLKRNMCQIELGLCQVALPSPSFKYFNVKQPGIFLSDLCHLISTSSKFPSTSICFNYKCELGNLELTSDLNNDGKDEHLKDLFRFLSLYGKKMRKLTFWSGISKKAVQTLLYVHMPHLTCLDLEYFHQFSMSDHDQEESPGMQVCLPSPQSTLELKEIYVGFTSASQNDKSNFLKELGRVSPNCTSIKHVHASSLGILLDMGKSHIIKDLHFDPTPAQLSAFQRFATLYTKTADATRRCSLPSLKLSKFTVGFTHLKNYSGSVEYDHDVVLKVFNLILRASKNSLKHLEVQIKGLTIPVSLFIPPLPRLEYLGLLDSPRSVTPRFHFLGDVIGREISASMLTADESAYSLQALQQNQVNQNRNIPADYFPRLQKINLRIKETRYNSDKLMGFFLVDQLRSNIPGDILFTVTSLELCNSFHPQYDVMHMSKVFPNVSHFRSLCDGSLFYQNCVWTLFPKLERFDILVLHHEWEENVVDSFFTGIHPECCAILDSDHSASHDLKTYPVHVYERSEPYIGDCKNLKEIEIRFRTKLTSRFVSNVTALHGFKDVIHRTKIIFSFESVTLSAGEIKETHRYLDPVAPYVEIRMKNKK